MLIDVSERIERAAQLTGAWSEAAGYKRPADADLTISKRANDVRRVLGASDFGCQTRNVHALCEALIGETIPKPDGAMFADYAQRAPFVVGSMLVPLRDERPGLVTRTSHSGNAGMRKSNGEMHNNHFQQADVRPASREEIETYFSELFGLTINPADALAPADDADPDVPF